MLGRLTSTPSGTRASYVLVTMLSAVKSRPSAATVCRKRYIIPARTVDDYRTSADNGCGGRSPAGQRHPGPGVVVPRGVDHDARLWQVRDVKLADREAERSG